ncbi:MAG: adenylate/guanylate cyclase domain-containing protein [Flavobacterium sp.]|nr:MAG: adenylate/guanylate cyclase domain-containing protein [Flavobacterium sp.]
MGILAHSWFVLTYTSSTYRAVFWEAFVSACFYALIIVLNRYKKYTVACHLFCIYNILCYSYFAIAHGKVDAAEYLLLPCGMASLLLFKNAKIIFIYLFFNFVLFWICKYSFTVIAKPFVVLPEDLYIPNHIFLFVISYLVVIYFKTENVRQEVLLNNQNQKLTEEKAKSDSLLLNILPMQTAEELKATGTAKPQHFASVTVMFTDFHNFTQIASTMPPEQLVAEIDACFGAFDGIINRHGLEKIKTIGDSYMSAGGLPATNETHTEDAVLAALEIRDFIRQRKEEKALTGSPYFDIRIGIHSGPVVAGVVGTNKFAYDIWGDTVNLASRMESCGEEGKINLSQAAYERVKEKFECSYRGKINAKNKGMVDMYFVQGPLLH